MNTTLEKLQEYINKVSVNISAKYNGVKPIIGAVIRYDAALGLWVRLDLPKEKVLESFAIGVMEKVTFFTYEAKVLVGCAGTLGTNTVGLATGDFYPNFAGSAMVGGRNLSFDMDRGFVDAGTGLVVPRASKLRLMSDRRAVYYP